MSLPPREGRAHHNGSKGERKGLGAQAFQPGFRTSNQYVYLASLFALGFLVFGPQLLIGVAAVGFVPKKAIGAADGIKGTFAYLIGDSFAKLGLGMIADGTPIFGLTGWAGTFAALDAAAIGCIVLMAMVAVLEERKIRREKRVQRLKAA
jgi:OPA family hexose phosphate transport protein UhpT-like MFS transporter